MPGNDRDQNFDKALARHLGSSSAPQANEGNDCLDAETLAAYHERLLDPEEMAQRKTHIASCERCQEILAQLEATDAIPVEADRDLLLDQIVLELPESEPAGAATAAEIEPHLESQPEPKSEEEVAADPMPAAPQKTDTPAAPALEPEPESASDLEIEHDPDLVAASGALPLLRSTGAASPGTTSPAPPLAAPVGSIAAAKSAPATSSTITFRSPREDRPKLVRYVALAGALAAGLIFWLVYRNQTQSVDVAQNHPQKLEMPPQSPAPPPPADEKAAASASQASEPMKATPQSSNAPSAQPERDASKSPTDTFDSSLDAAKKALDKAKSLEQKSRKDAAGSAAPTFTPRQNKAAIAGALSDLQAQSRTPQAAPTGLPHNGLTAARAHSEGFVPGSARKLEVPSAPPSAAPTAGDNASVSASSANTNSTSGIPATPPPARTKINPGVVNESVVVNANAAPVAQQQINPSQVDALKPVNNRVIATLSPLSVPAPSGKTIWRIGQAGMIQHSTDAGATWSIQPSGVVIDLIAGSAYSDQVCWLVGRNGTILRTINGGASWQKVASPSNVDLLAIFSINADSATITDAAGRAFETTTAGSHWTRTRLQQ